MTPYRLSRPIPWRRLFGLVGAVIVSVGSQIAHATDNKRIAFDFFSISTPLGWREQWMDSHGAYFIQQLPPNIFAKGCALSIGNANREAGSLKSNLEAYEHSSLPGTFDSEPMKFSNLKNGWEAVTRVYRNRYSPSIHKLVVLASNGGWAQWMTWDLTGDQVCQQAARTSLATLTLLPARRRIRSDGTQLAIIEQVPEREPTLAEKNDPTKYTRSCKAPSTTCLAPKVDRVGAACTCQNYRGLLEMGTIMP